MRPALSVRAAFRSLARLSRGASAVPDRLAAIYAPFREAAAASVHRVAHRTALSCPLLRNGSSDLLRRFGARRTMGSVSAVAPKSSSSLLS